MDDYIFCSECEEQYTCPEACKTDGCECGIKTKEEDKENERPK